MVSGYQVVFDKAMADLKAKDPATVCVNAVAEYSAIASQYSVPLYRSREIVDVI